MFPPNRDLFPPSTHKYSVLHLLCEFAVHNNYLSQPDALHHPTNTTWNAAAHGSLLAPFMPVPGSNVGVAISSYAAAQSGTAAYPGSFTARLSTFSSQPVTVSWAVQARPTRLARHKPPSPVAA